MYLTSKKPKEFSFKIVKGYFLLWSNQWILCNRDIWWILFDIKDKGTKGRRHGSQFL